MQLIGNAVDPTSDVLSLRVCRHLGESRMEEDDRWKQVDLVVPEDVSAVVASLVTLSETGACQTVDDIVVLCPLFGQQRRQRAHQVELGESRDLAHLDTTRQHTVKPRFTVTSVLQPPCH